MDTIPDRLTQVQELLLEVKLKLINQRKNPRMSDASCARILGISAPSFSHYINGQRLPDFETTFKLSRHPLIGKRIFNIVGYDEPQLPPDATPELSFMASNWKFLSREAQQEIFNKVKEYLNGTHERSHGGDEPG